MCPTEAPNPALLELGSHSRPTAQDRLRALSLEVSVLTFQSGKRRSLGMMFREQGEEPLTQNGATVGSDTES